MMYVVMAYDDMVCDCVVVFEGSFEECVAFAAEDEEYFIEEWDAQKEVKK